MDRQIAQLLGDPLTSLLMQADGVDRACLAEQLRRIARPQAASGQRAEASRQWRSDVTAGLCLGCAQ
ncbi:MAG: hypothetical protein P4M15_02865 [Alphaproteobacteria bacterium]|nr:hypothetical protein [Alphaproteobacteria bacterium]